MRGIALMAAGVLMTASCASGPGTSGSGVSRTVAASEDAVRDVVRSVLGSSPGYEEVDPDHWRTGWIEGESPRQEMGFIMRRPFHLRRRYAVSIARVTGGGTNVSVLCRIEEKGLAGARARTWEPVASDGAWEKAALDEVQKRLAAASPPPGKE